MYYKTINGVLPRNLIQTMAALNGTFDVEDYIYMTKCICTCESLQWQNLIGCMYVYISFFKKEIELLGLGMDIQILLDVWNESIQKINRRIKRFSRAIVCMAYQDNKELDNLKGIERKCKEGLEKLNNFSEICKRLFGEEKVKKLWEDAKKKSSEDEKKKLSEDEKKKSSKDEEEDTRLTSNIEKMCTNFWWAYIFLQIYDISLRKHQEI